MYFSQNNIWLLVTKVFTKTKLNTNLKLPLLSVGKWHKTPRQECVSSPHVCHSSVWQPCLFTWFYLFMHLPVDKAEVVLSVRGEPLLHSEWRVAGSCAADESWGSLGEKFAERLRSAALIAIFTPFVCVCVCVSTFPSRARYTWPRERAPSHCSRVERAGGGGVQVCGL